MDCNYGPKCPYSRLLHVVTHWGSTTLQLWLVSTKGNHPKAKAAKAFGSPTQMTGKILHYCLYKFINVCTIPKYGAKMFTVSHTPLLPSMKYKVYIYINIGSGIQFPRQLPTLFPRQRGRYSRWAVGIGSDGIRKVWAAPKITCYIIHRTRWKEGRDWGGDVICQDSSNACVLNHGICNESCSPATLTGESKQNVLVPKSIFCFAGELDSGLPFLYPLLYIPSLVLAK